ncbi:MAG: hypothetical protein PSV36_10565 [Algoriphagus sp.]|nr:hypothetical protein [Algoriphagus sp.]
MDDFKKRMWEDYHQIIPLSLEIYEDVFRSLILKKIKKGIIIKQPGTADGVSRYLCEGFIGEYVYVNGEYVLEQIFQPTDTVFDDSSFYPQIKTDVFLKALSDVVFLEFSKESELMVIKKSRELNRLSHFVIHRLTERKSNLNRIRLKRLEKGYPDLLKEYPGVETVLTQSDIASFFASSVRSVARLQAKLKKEDNGSE